MSGFEIRKARKSDLDDIVRVNLKSMWACDRELGDPVLPDREKECVLDFARKDWRKILKKIDNDRKKAGMLKLAFEDGALAGLVWYGRGRDEGFHEDGEIRALYVDPGFWRRGVGERLLTHAMDALRERGYKRLYLWTEHDNSVSQVFYRAMGGLERHEGGVHLHENGTAAVMFRWR